MREILFRGKSIYTGKWAVSVCPYGVMRSGHLCDDFIPDTVGQFTGLTDKNGKRIFEGDVVKFTDSPFGYSYNGVVCFDEGSFCIKYEYRKKEKFHRIGQTDEWQDMGASGIVTYQYEILGNIHDNPELLGGVGDG